MNLSPQQFSNLFTLLKNETAVVLETGKEYLVESRLSTLARDEGFQSLSDLVDAILTKHNPELRAKVLLALTTNETSFFRDLAPFEALKKTIVPGLLERRSCTKALSLWSAACSSGQEPYSLAMMLFDTFPQLAQWKVTIQASDLNPQVVAKAKEGVYSSIEVNRGLPVQYLIKYFEQRGAQFVVKEQLRNVIHFFALNLLNHWPQKPVDILFLRNVLIYFDVETKRHMFDKVYNILAPDGYLFLGAAETPYRIHDGFTREAVGTAIVYKKV